MHKNHLKKIFQLEGYILDRVEHQNNKTLLYCHVQKISMTYNGERSLKVNETRERRLSHMMLEDKRVILVITQRRFYFSKHKTKRWEKLPDVGKRKQTTNTFRINTLRELQRDNYSGTGFKRHKSHMYPAHILDGLDFKVKWKDEIRRIGMDGKGVGHNKVVHNIVNLDKNKPLIVLPDLSQKHVKKN
jgi:hypothetical protein